FEALGGFKQLIEQGQRALLILPRATFSARLCGVVVRVRLLEFLRGQRLSRQQGEQKEGGGFRKTRHNLLLCRSSMQGEIRSAPRNGVTRLRRALIISHTELALRFLIN